MRRRMIGLVLTALLIATGVMAQQNRQADVELQAAIRTETVKGDLRTAIKQYESLTTRYSKDRAFVANVLVRMADAYRKLGDVESRKIYERIVEQYAAQKEAAARALTALKGLSNGTADSKSLLANLVWRISDDLLWPTSISFDGQWMALTRNRGDESLVRDMRTGGLRSISRTADPPALSSDGRLIAYNFWGKDDLSSGSATLRVVANEPGVKPRIIRSAPEGVRYYTPDAFSADQKSLLITIANQDWSRQIGWMSIQNGAITVLKSHGWRLRGEESRLSLSPDGRFIAYAALAADPGPPPTTPPATAAWSIYILAADGSRESEFVMGNNTNTNVHWTADGQHLLFLSNRKGSFDLWSVAVEDGKADSKTLSLVRDLDGSTRPIGVTKSGAFYYVGTQEPNDDVYTVDFDSKSGKVVGNPVRVTENVIGGNIGGAWSPDGKRIAFKRRGPALQTDNYALVVRTIGTGEEVVIPTGNTLGDSELLRWFHSGRELLLPGRRERIDVATGKITPFPKDSKLTFLPRADISPDDATLFVAARENLDEILIAVVDLATGRVTRTVALSDFQGIVGFSISPDGSALALIGRPKNPKTNRQQEYQLSRINIDGSNYQQLYGPILLPGGRSGQTLNWTRDSKFILFGEPGAFGTPEFMTHRLVRIPVTGGTPEPIGLELKGVESGGLFIDLNSDGSKLIFNTREWPKSEVWTLDHLSSVLKNP